MAEKGVVAGSRGDFRPDDNITRGEVATIFQNLMGYQVAAENTFSDLPATAWYTKNMLKASAAGIFKGDGSGALNPQAEITRQEFFVTLARVLELTESAGGNFSDQKSIAGWAAPQVGALAKAGVF